MRTKLVVLNENVLGYIQPELPNYVAILHGSILKGYRGSQYGTILVGPNDTIRLASEKDFEDFRCVFGSFSNTKEYEYATV